MDVIVFVAIGVTGVAVGASIAAVRLYRRCRSFELRFAPVVDTEVEVARLRAEAEKDRAAAVQDLKRLRFDAEAEVARLRAESDKNQEAARQELNHVRGEAQGLAAQYAIGRARYEELGREVASLEESLSSVEIGLYRPHFTFADSESYKAAIEASREHQKALIKSDQAAVCGTSWTVGGSEREGERMVKQTQKVILRAFNAESEAAVANVSWSNYAVMEARIDKVFEVLNKLGTVLQVKLTDAYRVSRQEELKLVFEAAEKRQQERDELRRRHAEQREEEKVQRELQREQEEAAKDEAVYQKALVKAQAQLQATADGEREGMLQRIQELEVDLAAARDRKERAIAQAQLTKVGHVYVISNIGTFGEHVIKIGLTRRLDPAERVHELGDASVPFPFDIHALIYSENAPELEKRLHDHFWDRRLNWANDRKEFFRIEVPELQAQLTELGLKTELLTMCEAKQYRQTLAAQLARSERPAKMAKSAEIVFPVDPFEGVQVTTSQPMSPIV